MKPVLLGHNDGPSGAGRAVARLHSGLLEAGVQSRLLVAHSTANLVDTIAPQGVVARLMAEVRRYADQAPLKFYSRRQRTFFSTTFCAGDPRPLLLRAADHDLVHVHWHNGGFIHPSAFARFGKPIVWTIHDSWAFTGGCHVPGDCTRYLENCGACPKLGSSSGFDLSRLIWNRKHRAWRNLSMTLVTPSRWMAENIRKSRMLGDQEVHVIPNGIDTRIYRPFSKHEARKRLGLPVDGKIILFGAINATADENKGYDLLIAAMKELARRRSNEAKDKKQAVHLAIFGTSRDPRKTNLKHASGYPLIQLGSFADDLSLALAYSAADVMCVPSRQESFGQTAAEAMACGTSVVAFAATGLLDIVDHQKNGYLAQPYDPEEFARGIEWVLKKPGCGAAARRKIETDFSLDRIAQSHINLYKSLLS